MSDVGTQGGEPLLRGPPQESFASNLSHQMSLSPGTRNESIEKRDAYSQRQSPQAATPLQRGSGKGEEGISIPGCGQVSRQLVFFIVVLVGLAIYLAYGWSHDLSARLQTVALEKLRSDFDFELGKIRDQMARLQKQHDTEISRLRNTTATHGRDLIAIRSRHQAEVASIRQEISANPYASAPVDPPDDMLDLQLGSIPGMDEPGRPGVVVPSIVDEALLSEGAHSNRSARFSDLSFKKLQEMPREDLRRTKDIDYVKFSSSSSSDEISELIERLNRLESKLADERLARAGLEESTLTKLYKFEQHVSRAPFLAAKAATSHVSEAEARLQKAFDDAQETTHLRVNGLEVKLAKELDQAVETANQRHRTIEVRLEETVVEHRSDCRWQDYYKRCF